MRINRCPSCSSVNEPRSNFCQECGTALRDVSSKDDTPEEQQGQSSQSQWFPMSRNWTWTRRRILVAGFLIFVVASMIVGLSIEQYEMNTAKSITGLPICKEAKYIVLASSSGVSVGNLNRDCELQRVTVTLNGKYKCPSSLAVGDSPVARPITDCVDTKNGERFNVLTTVVVDCKVEIRRPRVYKTRCLGR